MAAKKLHTVLGVILLTLTFTSSAFSLVQIPILKGTVYSSITTQPVHSGHVEILDFNVTPPAVLYSAPIHTTGEYMLTNLIFPELDGIRIMAYPSDISWDMSNYDGNGTPPAGGNNPGSNGPINLTQAQVINSSYVLDFFVDWAETPDVYSLEQNYPNPFNPMTLITFGIPTPSNVTLKIYDMSGKVVSTLFNNELLSEGIRSVEFNGANLSSGVYFYSITAGEFSDIKKMTLVK